MILMATLYGNYSFIYINVGYQGRIWDGGIFRNKEFYKKVGKTSYLHFPQDKPLPGSTWPIPYTIVADVAFALSTHTIKPYSTDIGKVSPKRVFHYRPSRARCIFLNAFGQLASFSRIFQSRLK